MLGSLEACSALPGTLAGKFISQHKRALPQLHATRLPPSAFQREACPATLCL